MTLYQFIICWLILDELFVLMLLQQKAPQE